MREKVCNNKAGRQKTGRKDGGSGATEFCRRWPVAAEEAAAEPVVVTLMAAHVAKKPEHGGGATLQICAEACTVQDVDTNRRLSRCRSTTSQKNLPLCLTVIIFAGLGTRFRGTAKGKRARYARGNFGPKAALCTEVSVMANRARKEHASPPNACRKAASILHRCA